MTTRANEECRVCGGPLRGTQRRWLFGGRRQPPRGGPPASWGSVPSLRADTPPATPSSSSSLPPSPSARPRPEPLAVLTHLLGRPVPRGGGRGEFLCGKCAAALGRVFRFDAVIARVRALSAERLRRLEGERARLGRRLAEAYGRRHRAEEEEEEEEGGRPGEAYWRLLRDDMAFAGLEWWAEGGAACPRGCWRRGGGRSCGGCDALRVPDSDYESVCGLPRRLAQRPLLPRGAARSLSLDGLGPAPLPPAGRRGALSLGSTPSSLASSSLSLPGLDGPASGPASRSASALSLFSGGGADPFDGPGGGAPELTDVLRRLKGIQARPVASPAGSRLPVRDRSRGRGLARKLSFGEGLEASGEEEEEEEEEEERDVLTQLGEEYIPLHRERAAARQLLQNAVGQLRGQLDQAQARIRTLEAELRGGTRAAQSPDVPAGPAVEPPENGEHSAPQWQGQLVHRLGQSLHSRERIVQDCLGLLKKVTLGSASELQGALIERLQDRLKERELAIERALDSKFSELRQRDRELESLRRALREKDRDLSRLAAVLQSNEDTIHELRAALGRQEGALRDARAAAQREREAWRRRDAAQGAALLEKTRLAGDLQGALESTARDVQALSESVIGRGVEGGGAESQLASQLREKGDQLARALKEREEHCATQWQEVEQLTAALHHLEVAMQARCDGHSQALDAVSARLAEALRELREKEREVREGERQRACEREEQERETRGLRERLENRDQLIQQVLNDAEEKDRLLSELQQTLLARLEPRTALKDTL